MSPGEEKAWKIIVKLDPGEVCRRASVSFDAEAGYYSLESLGKEIRLLPRERNMFSDSPGSDILLQRLGYFFNLSALWYLVTAKDIPLTGRLVKPMNLKGGQLFFRGTHLLPLDAVAGKYGNDLPGFLTKGKALGGSRSDYGDASIRLLPLPRIPVVLILWRGNEEFPPRGDLLLDSTCELQIPLDIIWSIAMTSLLVLL